MASVGTKLAALLGFVGFSALAGVVATVGVTPVVAVAGVGTTSVIDVFDSLPEYIEIGTLPQRNELYAYQGGQPVHFATVWDQNREELDYDEIAETLKHAAVDGEDRRFWEHGGIDVPSVVRATVGSLTGSNAGGASTLPMQLVRNIRITKALSLPTAEQRDAAYAAAIDRSAQRKVGEMKLAIGLSKKYSKKQILAAYLNIAYFGDQTYGVQAAAQRYYGKNATDLTPAEAASLIAIVQWPDTRNLADPSRYEKNRERRDVVLRGMHDAGHLSDADLAAALASSPADYVHLTPVTQGCSAAAGTGSQFFCDYAVQIVKSLDQLGPTQKARDTAWRTGGYRVQTTLDLDLVAEHRALLDRYDPNTETRLALGAVLDSVEVGTGRILSMAQNKDHDQSPSAPPTATSINYSTDKSVGGSNGFQTGSTSKLFTLLAWLESGRGLGEVVNGTPHAISTWKQCDATLRTTWAPKNDTTAQRGNYSVLEATAHSVNAAYASMAAKLDLCDIRDVAERLGVHTALGAEPSINPSAILGTDSVAPLTMAAAYATVASGGTYCAPIAIDGVVGPDGKDLGGQPRRCSQALTPAVAKQAATALQRTVAGGTAAGAQTPDRTALLAKTGTTDNADQIWLVGASTRVATAYWQGNTDGRTTSLRKYASRYGTYAGTRANVWRQAQTAVNQRYPATGGWR